LEDTDADRVRMSIPEDNARPRFMSQYGDALKNSLLTLFKLFVAAN